MPKGGSTTTAQTIDPGTQAYVDKMRQFALGQTGQYSPFINAGQQGLGALTGGANPFMNPYTSQMDPYFAQQREQAVRGANQQATLMGAFGGDRSQIGAATAGNLADQNAAGFRYQGFNDSLQRALQAAQLGYGALGMQGNALAGAVGPYGTTQRQTVQTDPWQQLLGLGLTAGGFLLGGPPGAAAGSAIGNGLDFTGAGSKFG